MPSGGHWRGFTQTCVVLLALVSSGRRRRVLTVEGVAGASPAQGDYFSFASSSKCSAAVAGPCFAFRSSQEGLPDLMFAAAFLQALTTQAQRRGSFLPSQDKPHIPV